jgi:RNA ligase
VRIDTGEEAPFSTLRHWSEVNDLRLADHFEKPLSQCVTEDIENEEGYVVAWHRPGTWPLRVKVKMETYRRLHHLLTGTNPVTVWEMLKEGLDLTTLVTGVPADFVSWINSVESSLQSSYKVIEDASLAALAEYEGEKNTTTPEERKKFALYAVTKPPLTPVLFSMLDGKEYAPIIWKMVRPKATDTFKVDIDL